MTDKKKNCYSCKHYGSNVNQGIRWCLLGDSHFDEDAENCEKFDEYEVRNEDVYSYTSTIINPELRVLNPMAEYRKTRARKKRKKERGVKHGRRNK